MSISQEIRLYVYGGALSLKYCHVQLTEQISFWLLAFPCKVLFTKRNLGL